MIVFLIHESDLTVHLGPLGCATVVSPFHKLWLCRWPMKCFQGWGPEQPLSRSWRQMGGNGKVTYGVSRQARFARARQFAAATTASLPPLPSTSLSHLYTLSIFVLAGEQRWAVLASMIALVSSSSQCLPGGHVHVWRAAPRRCLHACRR